MEHNRNIRDGVEGRENFSKIISVTERLTTKDLSFKSIKVQNLYNWWQSFSPEVPSKSSFDIADHIRDAEGYFLYSVLAEKHFHVKLLGEKAIDLLGNQYTDIVINEETAKKDAHLDGLIHYLQRILTEKTSFWCEGTFVDQFNRQRQFQSIDCPLVNAEGKITHIVGVMEATK